MNGLDLLLQNIFNYPAQKEYFTKLFIFSKDQSGNNHHLILFEKDNPPRSLNDIRIFCDKVRVGETLKVSVERSLREGFGIDTIKHFEENALFETDYNRHGELLPRVGVKVEVPFQEKTKSEVQGLSLQWISDKEWEELSKQDPFATRYYTQEEIEKVIQDLEKADYFKFVPVENREKVKQGLKKGLEKGKLEAIEKIEDGISYTISDGRFFHADEENLYDGFMSDVFEEVKPTLTKENVTITSVGEEITSDHEHYVTINGISHLIYKHEDREEVYYWAVAFKKLIELLNELLREAGSRERFYAVASGNDASIILLTPELYDYMLKLQIDPFWAPYDAEDIDLGE